MSREVPEVAEGEATIAEIGEVSEGEDTQHVPGAVPVQLGPPTPSAVIVTRPGTPHVMRGAQYGGAAAVRGEAPTAPHPVPSVSSSRVPAFGAVPGAPLNSSSSIPTVAPGSQSGVFRRSGGMPAATERVSPPPRPADPDEETAYDPPLVDTSAFDGPSSTTRPVEAARRFPDPASVEMGLAELALSAAKAGKSPMDLVSPDFEPTHNVAVPPGIDEPTDARGTQFGDLATESNDPTGVDSGEGVETARGPALLRVERTVKDGRSAPGEPTVVGAPRPVPSPRPLGRERSFTDQSPLVVSEQTDPSAAWETLGTEPHTKPRTDSARARMTPIDPASQIAVPRSPLPPSLPSPVPVLPAPSGPPPLRSPAPARSPTPLSNSALAAALASPASPPPRSPTPVQAAAAARSITPTRPPVVTPEALSPSREVTPTRPPRSITPTRPPVLSAALSAVLSPAPLATPRAVTPTRPPTHAHGLGTPVNAAAPPPVASPRPGSRGRAPVQTVPSALMPKPIALAADTAPLVRRPDAPQPPLVVPPKRRDYATVVAGVLVAIALLLLAAVRFIER